MDLWIRSQDRKKLISNPKLSIREENGFSNKDIYDCSSGYILGTYSTELRALEVLSEIQKKIVLLGLSNNFGSPMIDLDNPYNIYIMPEE